MASKNSTTKTAVNLTDAGNGRTFPTGYAVHQGAVFRHGFEKRKQIFHGFSST